MSKRISTKSWILGSYLVYNFLVFLNRDEAALLVYAMWEISFLFVEENVCVVYLLFVLGEMKVLNE